MGLDIRLPLGGLFMALGLLLTVYGLFGDSSVYQRSLGINVNLGWGIVLLIFGLVMATLARRDLSPRTRNGNLTATSPRDRQH